MVNKKRRKPVPGKAVSQNTTAGIESAACVVEFWKGIGAAAGSVILNTSGGYILSHKLRAQLPNGIIFD